MSIFFFRIMYTNLPPTPLQPPSMSCFLFVDDDENVSKIDIDSLYDKRHRRDLKQVAIFNKLLNRIHKRITLTARNKSSTEQHIWFVVPEYIFGEPVYDKGDCIAYLVAKLESNKFHIRYIHPNTLFVSWSHFVPSYVRQEFKKKTGIAVDEYGNVKERAAEHEDSSSSSSFSSSSSLLSSGAESEGSRKVFTPIDQYKPTGNLVYAPEMLEKIERKVKFA